MSRVSIGGPMSFTTPQFKCLWIANKSDMDKLEKLLNEGWRVVHGVTGHNGSGIVLQK